MPVPTGTQLARPSDGPFLFASVRRLSAAVPQFASEHPQDGQGDLDQARLFEPTDRNRNPAEFELSDFEELINSSIPDSWEEGTHGSCWDLLEPVLKEVGEYALVLVRKENLNVHPEFELSVNGRQDWYQFTW